MYIGVNMVSIKIHIFTLPMNSTYVHVNQKFRNKIQKIIENGGSDRLSEITRMNEGYFYRFLNGKMCSVYFLFKLYNNLGIDIQEIERNVTKVVSSKNNSIGIKNPKFPFILDSRHGGKFLGAIMGDGSRTKLGGITYNNRNEKLVRSVLKSVQKIFGNVDYRLTWKKDGTLQLDLPKIVGDVVSQFGIEKSYKTISDCSIEMPEFSKNFKINFIRQFFDDEGNVRKSDRRLQIKQTRNLKENSKEKIRKRIEKYAPRILLQIKKELENIGITSTLSLEYLRIYNRKIKGDFALNVYGKENLEKFRKIINYSIPYKRILLRNVIKSYRFPSAPRNGRINFALSKARIVQDKHGYITKHLLVVESKRSLKTATYFLVDLKKKGYVKVVEKPRGKNGIPLPQKYVLCNEPS